MKPIEEVGPRVLRWPDSGLSRRRRKQGSERWGAGPIQGLTPGVGSAV
jgi:hypothetical protein